MSWQGDFSTVVLKKLNDLMKNALLMFINVVC